MKDTRYGGSFFQGGIYCTILGKKSEQFLQNMQVYI